MAKQKFSLRKSQELKSIHKEARRLQREYPNRYKNYRDYFKQANAIYAEKHGGHAPVGRKHSKKAGIVTKGRHTDINRNHVEIQIGRVTARQHIAEARKLLEDELSGKYIRQLKARTKTEKKKIGKEMAELRRKLNRLK